MNDTNNAKIRVLKELVHDPHNIGQNAIFCVKSCHEQGHITGALMIHQDQRSLIHARCDIIA